MRTVEVLDGQTLIDIATQYLGDPTRVMEIADMNGKNLTDTLVSGSIINVPDADSSKRSIVSFFSNPAHAPACGITDQDANVGSGIGFWYLENDFVVQ